MLDPRAVQQEIADAPSDEARLSVLLERSMSGYRTHPKEALRWAKQALALSKVLGRPLDRGRARFRIGCAHLQLAEYDKARTALNTSIAELRAVEEGDRYTDAPQFMLAELDRKQGRLEAALKLYDEVLQARRTFGKNNTWEVLVAIGIARLQSGDLASALHSFYDGLDSIDREKNLLARSIITTNIGVVFLENRDQERASRYLEKALALQREIKDEAGMASTLNNLASLANQRGDYNAARSYATQTLDLGGNPACKPRVAYAEAILGEVALSASDDRLAIQHFERGIALAADLQLEALAVETQVGLAEALLHSRPNSRKALDYLTAALRYSRKHGQKTIESRALELLAHTYRSRGDFEKAAAFFADHVALNRELRSEQSMHAIVELQSRVELEQIEHERQRLEAVAATATERAALLEQERERQSTELTALALQLVQKNEFLTELRERFQAEPSLGGEPLVRDIDDHVRNDRDWEVFQDQLNRVHGDFLKTLSQSYPQLTPMELRTCALLKLNFSSKAIASLLCISLRTVENHRLSIRKKLGLAADVNLSSFLASV